LEKETMEKEHVATAIRISKGLNKALAILDPGGGKLTPMVVFAST
jgi:hypothetical protein